MGAGGSPVLTPPDGPAPERKPEGGTSRPRRRALPLPDTGHAVHRQGTGRAGDWDRHPGGIPPPPPGSVWPSCRLRGIQSPLSGAPAAGGRARGLPEGQQETRYLLTHFCSPVRVQTVSQPPSHSDLRGGGGESFRERPWRDREERIDGRGRRGRGDPVREGRHPKGEDLAKQSDTDMEGKGGRGAKQGTGPPWMMGQEEPRDKGAARDSSCLEGVEVGVI